MATEEKYYYEPEGKYERHGEICKELGETYRKKNEDYGDSFSQGFIEYGMTMAVIRLEDKVRRLKHLLTADPRVVDESIDDTLKDLANYAIMTLIERDVQKRLKEDTDRILK